MASDENRNPLPPSKEISQTCALRILQTNVAHKSACELYQFNLSPCEARNPADSGTIPKSGTTIFLLDKYCNAVVLLELPSLVEPSFSNIDTMSTILSFNESLSVLANEVGKPWKGFLQGEVVFPSFLVLFGIIGAPALAILLNILWQLVSLRNSLTNIFVDSLDAQISVKDRSLPPVVFHWIPFLGSALSYGTDPIQFLLRCREKVRSFPTIKT